MNIKFKLNRITYKFKDVGDKTFRQVVQSFRKQANIQGSEPLEFNHGSTKIIRDKYDKTLNTLFPNEIDVKLHVVLPKLKHSNLTPLTSGSIFEAPTQKIKQLETEKERILEEQSKILANISAQQKEADDLALQLAIEMSRLEFENASSNLDSSSSSSSSNSSADTAELPSKDFTPASDHKRKRSDLETEEQSSSKRVKTDETKKSETKGKKKDLTP